MKLSPLPFLLAVLILGAAACSPKIGSDAWCANMKEKPKGDWSTNEATAYTKHCLFTSEEE